MFANINRFAVASAFILIALIPSANADEPAYTQGFEDDVQSVSFAQAEHLLDANEARSGEGCLKATFPEEKGGIPVIFDFAMDPEAVYLLSLWARSDNACGMGVGIMNTWEDREDVTRFYPIPKKWTQYQTTLVPMESGCKAMWLYLPHTFLANPGTVWVDDITITEVGRCTGEPVSAHEGYAQDVALTATGPNAALLAWLDHTPAINTLEGKDIERDAKGVLGLRVAPTEDRLLVREYQNGLWGPTETLATGWLMHPAVAADSAGVVCAVWSERNGDDEWALRTRYLRDGAWSAPMPGPGVGRNPCFPALATNGTGVWTAAWSAMDDGAWSVYAATVGPDVTGEAVKLSQKDQSGYRPAIAVTASGTTWVAWQAFDGTDYQIAGRYASPDGAWSDTLVLADGPDDEGHPVLRADRNHPDRVWLAYDVGVIPIGGQPKWGRSTAQRGKLRVEVRAIEGTNIATLPVPYDTFTCNRGERPALAVDTDGGLWLFERAMGSTAGHWGLCMRHTLPSGTWSTPYIVSGGQPGTWLPAAPVALEDGVLAVWQTDQRRADRVTHRNDEATSWLVGDLLRRDTGQPVALETVHPASVAETTVREADSLPSQLTFDGTDRHVYWGDVHIHSRLSLCARDRDLDPFDAYVYTRDYEDIDFMALTDHGAHTNHADWFNTMKLASLLNAPGHFTALLAQEWSSARAYRPDGKGHRNILYPGAEVPNWFHPHFGMMPAELYSNLPGQGMPAIIIPHQIADGSGGAWTDWSHSDPSWEPLAEVFQIRGSYEYLGAPWMAPAAQNQPGSFYQDALGDGRRVGVVASSDHGGGHGKVAVLAERLDRQPVFDAMKSRRTYGTSNAHIFLDFRVNNELMGGVTEGSNRARTITIRAEASQPLQEVVVFKNRQKIMEDTSLSAPRYEKTFTDQGADKAVDWYYLRVIQEDGHLAWSSPVWVGERGQN